MRLTATRTLELPGGAVRVYEAGAGSGAPSVLISGGMGSAPADWDPVLARLGVPAHVVWLEGVRPAYRGEGADAPVRWTAERTHLAAEALSLPVPRVLVGHSIGGVYAQGAARLFADTTGGVLLVDSTLASDRSRVPAAARALAYAVLRALLVETGLAAVLARPVRRLAVWAGTVRGEHAPPDADVRAWYADRRVILAILDDWAVSDAALDDLDRIATEHPFPVVPATFVVGGCKGRPRPGPDPRWVEGQRRLAASIPQASVVVLEDAAHLVMLDRPDAVAAALAGLLAA
jgi:pimeloyl-ACP methyl ester carboxylesterase